MGGAKSNHENRERDSGFQIKIYFYSGVSRKNPIGQAKAACVWPLHLRASERSFLEA